MNKRLVIKTLRPFAKLLDDWINDADTPPIPKGKKYLTMPIAIADLELAKSTYAKLVKK